MKLYRGNNLTRSIVADLGRAIVGGKYNDETFPNEAQLAEQYSASRNVVREAVKILGEKGLLSSRPKIGTKIRDEDEWNILDSDVLNWFLGRKLSLPLLMELTQVRLQIEPAAAALAASSAGPEEIEAIRVAIEDFEASENGDGDQLEADIAFHLAIVKASGNRFFFRMSSLIETALRFSIRFTNKYKSELTHVVSHREIFTAIENHDEDKAHDTVVALLSNVERIIKEQLSE
ncbi:MAG TPA: FadR family transcriptional regulator [Hellea balneolensis]|uniref:FadR family transcriptional regulator n=1 Tax=Hellea balneolensis TaxID=287478 RepID=A0A7C5M2F9_9PROT|nr:FadR family transcriptional regulator [Hellea balneolensis]